MRRQRRVLRFLVAALFPLILTCSVQDKTPLPEYMEAVAPELANHLARSDDSTLARFGRDVGYQLFAQALQQLARKSLRYLEAGSPEMSAEVEVYRRRIATVLATEFHSPEWLARVDFVASLPASERLELEQVWQATRETTRSPGLTAAERIERQRLAEVDFERFGDRWGIAICKHGRGELWMQDGDATRAKAEFWASYRDFDELGWRVMTCQVLGELGFLYSDEGKTDSMVICYEEAKRIAHRSRLPQQAARIYSFYAGYYKSRGRWSVANELLDQAQRVCREYKGGKLEARFVNDAIKLNAELGCWDVVARLVERARLLERQHQEQGLDLFSLVQLELDLNEARMLMAKGRVGEAIDIFERALPAARNQRYPSQYVRFLYYYVDDLLRNGLTSRALPLIAEAREASVDVFPDWYARFLFLEAKAAFQSNDGASASRLLDEFGDTDVRYENQLRNEWIERDALLVELNLAAGDRNGAARALATGMRRFQSYLRDTDAGAAGYIWLQRCEPLKQAAHDLVAGDPLLGYGLEMYWRETVRELGAGSRDADDATGYRFAVAPRLLEESTILDQFRSRARASVDNIRSRGAYHLLYAVAGEEVLRWTVAREAFRVDTVTTHASELRALAAETWSMMSTPSGADADVPLVRKLKALGQVLLPTELLDDPMQQPPLVLITTDGFLGRVPFEAFDPSTEGAYRPLLMNHDVAYLRYQRGTPERARERPGLLLVNTAPSEGLRFNLRRRLQEATAEADVVRSVYRDVRLLTGGSATKAALETSWENASFLYVAAHTSRDPEVPYLAMISLFAPENDPTPDAGFLEIADIRTADLSSCDVVVLSGCSTGAPYVDTHTEGPSLGDAFVDAGAGAVVQTHWDVRDDQARELMTSFVRMQGSLDSNTVGALNRARRVAMIGPTGVRHPSVWAAYSITLSHF